MDTLNDYYPVYPPNPDAPSASDSDYSEDFENIKKMDKLNNTKKRKNKFTIDDFCLKYNDEMWYIWCIIKDYSENSHLLDRLDFPNFCQLCYENSSKY
jgi:hypothetical protein